MKAILLPLFFIFVFSFEMNAQSGPTIDWELVNPFRFIQKQSVIDDLRRVYQKEKDVSPQRLERLLQDEADRDAMKIRNEAIANGTDCTLIKNKEKCYAPFSGWWAKIAEGDDFQDCMENNKSKNYLKECALMRYSATCWDSSYRKFRQNHEVCRDYVHPVSHKVRVWVNSDSAVVNWQKNGSALAFSKCEPSVQKRNCIEFDLPYTVNSDDGEWSESQRTTISAVMADGARLEAKVHVNDRLVVGLGDSYASGEGNPDMPATFTRGRTDVDFLYRLKVRRNPQKDKNAPAAWLDLGCHRSMYSYQFKTALHMALENPKEAVTYMSYACSGGTTANIIEERQDPQEQNIKKRPQLQVIHKLLTGDRKRPRTIDYLLVSTGGNDVNFAKFVSYVVTSGFVKMVASKKPRTKTAAEIERTLLGQSRDGNYFKLKKALLEGENRVPIRGCTTADKECKRILLTAYPDIIYDQDGKLCDGSRKEFDVPFKADPSRKERIRKIEELILAPLKEIQDRSESAVGWTVVKQHRSAYRSHGFCAQRAGGEGTGEIFVMPKRDNNRWITFAPWDYKPYESRSRWIRLPIDSKLTTDQQLIFRTYSFDLFFSDDRANIMHPTAEGHAATADANLQTIKGLR